MLWPLFFFFFAMNALHANGLFFTPELQKLGKSLFKKACMLSIFYNLVGSGSESDKVTFLLKAFQQPDRGNKLCGCYLCWWCSITSLFIACQFTTEVVTWHFTYRTSLGQTLYPDCFLFINWRETQQFHMIKHNASEVRKGFIINCFLHL